MPASRVEPRESFPQLHKTLDNLDAQHRLSRFMGGTWGKKGLLSVMARPTAYLGHGDQAALLDGGLDQWTREKRPTSTQTSTGKPGSLTVHLHPEIVAKMDYIKKLVDQPEQGMVIVDARPSKRYRNGCPEAAATLLKARSVSGSRFGCSPALAFVFVHMNPVGLRAQVCPPRSGATEKRIAKRPPQEHINAAFAELLDDIQFSKVRINQGYVKLGLHVTD